MKENIKDKLATGVNNTVPHVFCCAIPNVVVQSVNFASAIANGLGLAFNVFSGVSPILSEWLVKPYTVKLIDKVEDLLSKNKNDVCIQCNHKTCDHSHDKKKTHPLQREFWQDKWKDVLLGYGFTILTIGGHAIWHHYSEEGHDHANNNHATHAHYHMTHDELCTKEHGEAGQQKDTVFYFGMHNKLPVKATP